ncbi:MAG: integrase, partial [Candidatus Thiodiazotropha sp.]
EPADSLSDMIYTIDAYQSLDPLHHVREVCPISVEDIRKEQREDPDFKPMITYLEDRQVPEDRNQANRIVAESQYYILENDVLHHLYQPRSTGHKWMDVKKQLAVPTKLRDHVLKSYHDALTGGHQGQERTYEAIRSKYFWPRMYADIQTYVKTCEECQQAKRYIHQKQALLKPLPIGNVFSRLHIDILGPLPKSKEGYRYILMIVDAFSKWTEALPLHTMEAREIAWKLYDEIICRFGCPDSILTDRGQNFMSLLLKELCHILRITKLRTSSYHAAGNAQIERMNSVVLQKLRIYGNNTQTDWAQLLPSIMFSYRTTPAIDSTNYSPYFIMFGRECKMPLDTDLIPSSKLNQTTEQHLNRIIQNQKIVREIVSENIAKAQAKYKAQHDKNAEQPKFEVQSNVWLYNPRTAKGLSPKLINRWVGPYYVSEKLSDCNFRLRDLKSHKAIKAVVHANRLKPYFDPNTRPTNPPPGLQEPVETLDTDDNEDSEDEEQQPDQQRENMGDDSDEEQLQQADTTATLQENLTPEKILRAYPNFRGEGKMLYKVRYRDTATNKTKTTYTYDSKLPDCLRKNFHIKYTYSGKARKRSHQSQRPETQ